MTFLAVQCGRGCVNHRSGWTNLLLEGQTVHIYGMHLAICLRFTLKEKKTKASLCAYSGLNNKNNIFLLHLLLRRSCNDCSMTSFAETVTVCFGSMFIDLPKNKTKEMIQRGELVGKRIFFLLL